MKTDEKYSISRSDIVKGLIPLALLAVFFWTGKEFLGMMVLSHPLSLLVILLILLPIWSLNMAIYYYIYYKMSRLNLNPPNPVDLFLGMNFHLFLLETCKKTENKELKRLYLIYKIVAGISVSITAPIIYSIISS